MATFTRILETVGRNTITAVGTRRTNPSRTGRAQKVISNAREPNRINNGHHLQGAAPIDLLKAAATIDRLKAAPNARLAAWTDLVVEVGPAIWIARRRIGHVAIFQASASRTFNAAAPVVEIPVVIALGVAALEVIALVVAVLAEADALADSAVAAAGSGADGK